MNQTTKPPELPAQPVSVTDWLASQLLFAIPVINILAYLYWSFAPDTNPSKRNFCRAALILVGVGIAFIVLFVGLAVAIGVTSPGTRGVESSFPWDTDPRPHSEFAILSGPEQTDPSLRMFTYVIRVSSHTSESDIETIAQKLIQDLHPVDSAILFFYDHPDYHDTPYNVAKAMWGPDPTKPLLNSGDYTNHVFEIELPQE